MFSDSFQVAVNSQTCQWLVLFSSKSFDLLKEVEIC